MARLSDPIAISPKQVETISKMFPGETVFLRAVLGDTLDGAIHVEAPGSKWRDTLVDRQAGALGITLSSLEALKEDGQEHLRTAPLLSKVHRSSMPNTDERREAAIEAAAEVLRGPGDPDDTGDLMRALWGQISALLPHTDPMDMASRAYEAAWFARGAYDAVLGGGREKVRQEAMAALQQLSISNWGMPSDTASKYAAEAGRIYRLFQVALGGEQEETSALGKLRDLAAKKGRTTEQVIDDAVRMERELSVGVCERCGHAQERAALGGEAEPIEETQTLDEIARDMAPEPLQDDGEQPEMWRVAFNNGDAAEAVQRVEDMLNGDPLRRHATLTPEQFALDSKLMAKQIVANVLAALKGEPRPS
jgi:hypothetical protein